jgi:hypothetical protein
MKPNNNPAHVICGSYLVLRIILPGWEELDPIEFGKLGSMLKS